MAEFKKNVANLARVDRLTKFDDLSVIGDFAERFGLDPDAVFNDSSFATVMKFMVMWKESGEYHERFQDIWSTLYRPDIKNNTMSPSNPNEK
jgi:hypothetical protein